MVSVTPDGTSANLTMYQMHQNVKHSTVTNHEEKNIVYKKKKRVPEDDPGILFICDQPYLVKMCRINRHILA